MKSVAKLGAMMSLAMGAWGVVACSTSHPVSEAKVSAASPTDIIHREDAINTMADAICKRYESCSAISKGGKYATLDDCHAAEHQKWAQSWSADDCGGEKHGVVADKVRECRSRAEQQACGGNFLDKISEWNECRTGNVCKERHEG